MKPTNVLIYFTNGMRVDFKFDDLIAANEFLLTFLDTYVDTSGLGPISKTQIFTEILKQP